MSFATRSFRGTGQISKCLRVVGAITGSLILILQLGCQRRSNRWEPGKSFKTQIIVSKSFGTEFREVELKGVLDKGTLMGSIVDFYYSPGDDNGTLIGTKPLARFIEDDGVYIPADQISLQMVTLYYHLQQLKELELEARNSEQSLLSWPRKVALAVRVINAPDMRYDNAFYNSRVDALYFVPYKDKAFPIPLNPGIVAHEHFHSYFSYEVLNPLVKKNLLSIDASVTEVDEQNVMNNLYNLYVLKIVNEGLADVWGWIYSHDPDFVAISLPKAGSTRNLEKGSDYHGPRLSSEKRLKNEIRMIIAQCLQEQQRCVGDNAYGYGTVLARGLKSFAEARIESTRISDEAGRKMMAEKVLGLISEIQKSFTVDQTLSLDKVLSLWEKEFDSISDSECQVLQETASEPGVVKCASNVVLSAQ